MTSTPARPLSPDTVLVADQLACPGREAVACPAAPILAGQPRRAGLRTVRGPLTMVPLAEHTMTCVAVMPGSAGTAGLGLAASTSANASVVYTALADCLRAAGRRRDVSLASPRSFCAGVERAIETVEQLLEQRGAPVYVRKQIVHNAWVVADLEARGVLFVDELDAVPAGATGVFSAHGVSPAVRAEAAPTQTTLAWTEAAEIIAAPRARFPKIRSAASNDICYASTNRQDALTAVAREADLVLVIGSRNSSNSLRLTELARGAGTSAELIDGPEDIRPEWIVDAGVIGLTAGASAPPHLTEAVLDALAGLGPISVSERETTIENVHFALPLAVRS